MRNIDTSRLARLSIAGAIAGFFVFLIINPGTVREENMLHYRPTGSEILLDAAYMDMAIAALTGIMVILADEFRLLMKRLALRLAIVLTAGLIMGAICGVIGQTIFSLMTAGGGLLALLPARALGWGILGVGAGAGVGLATMSAKRMQMSILGGLIGGLIGGALFDVVGIITQGGSASRFIGYVLMCAAVGAAISYVEDVAKQNWVTVLTGSREGKSYIITKPVTTLGRDEMADIPLFGDMSVNKQHAVLQLSGNAVTLQSSPGALASVNGSPAPTAQLRDSDVISLGKHSLRFYQKAAQNAAYPDPASGYSPPVFPTPYPQARPVVQARGNLSLTVVMGPHTNQAFHFGAGLIRIGREADCQVCLSNDAGISRHHAEIGWDGVNWHIRDAGSRNGLYINGARISQQMLAFGDHVAVGQTVMRIDGV